MKFIYVLVLVSLIAFPLSTFADDLQDISDGLVKDSSTFEQTITILCKHVYDRMKPNGNGITLAEARRMTNEKKYHAGVGWCNHQVDVFMQFCQRQGIKTRMLYLLNEDKSASPHTIAEAYDGNKWVVVDVSNNLIFEKKNGQLMSRQDMSNNWEICLERLLVTGEGNAEYWEMFLRDCYKVKVLEP